MKIIFLDAESLGDDADYSEFEQLGEVVRYPRTSPEEVPERTADADVIVVNFCRRKPETRMCQRYRNQQS